MHYRLLKFHLSGYLRLRQMVCVCFILFSGLFYHPVSAQLPAGFVAKKLTGDVINEATAMAHASDGRIFIAERSGRVKVWQNDVVSTVHTVTTTTASEQGLLGITLHPQFATNGKCYIFYTNPGMTRHYLDIIVINTANQVTGVTRVMEFDPIINGFHNGGALLFRNGLLYIAIGESNSPAESNKLDTYRGKVLRLTENGDPAPGNPYYNEAGASRQKRSIWAIGFRNPWRMSLDPVSQKLFVIDVGGNYEEINDVTNPDPAKNYDYGWEQRGRTGPEQPATTIAPAFYYGHSGWGCAITTALFFNPPATNYPAQYRNRFYFSDWCAQWLRSVDASNPGAGWQEFASGGFGSVLGTSVGIDGNIYYVRYNSTGSIWRIEYANNQAPTIVNQPVSQTVVAGDPVTFSVSASGATPLSYQWQRNGVNIAGATGTSYTINAVAAADAANYRCVVTNPSGTVNSQEARLTVQPFNARPVPKIITPVSSLTWNALDVVNFSGSASDPEDGELPASAFSWEVRFFHKDSPTSEHWHPGPVVPGGIKSGSFVADNGGESSPNIWFRVLLTVTDSQGRTGVDSVDIQPNKVILTAAANVAGLKLVLGTEGVAPFSKTFVVNTALALQANGPQVLGNNSYTFSSWNHGGPASQSLRVPAVNTTYTANYTATGLVQAPYTGTPVAIPGKIEAENFDKGGEGIAYHDSSPGNAGNNYRTTEDVDIEPCAEGGYNIGYVATGEWLEYTVNVTAPGVYTVAVRVAAPGAGRSFHLELDGQNISGTVAVPSTGGFQAWQTVTVTTPALTTGVKVLRLVLDANDFNVNYLTFSNGGSPSASKFIPGRIEAESYDEMSGVQKEGTSDTGGGENIGWIDNGDWMDYLVNVRTAGTYTVQFRVSSAPGGGQLQLRSGDNVLTTQNIAGTGGWQSWTTLTATVNLPAGDQTLRIYAAAGNWNFNWMEFTSPSGDHPPQQQGVVLYPNPVHTVLTVTPLGKDGKYIIINAANNQQTTVRAADGKLDVSRLAPGTYILRFQDGNKAISKKFIKL
ncbi:carbohydrate-binding protein [Chitinophaga pendula]|uniref:carbohydrate-binding protein n=1 Tax=Chitinophaga TaxID=79328 RepID=UPI000BAFA786|nr:MULTISPECIES: carbohydrate-binding protein [Chitinophaga]ASZ12668.1 carbohydrate-binding protein [Chitinophaga sp. MD30]UCJ09721.1 carbohydrate-binding protein [Chitinophaga pendula]